MKHPSAPHVTLPKLTHVDLTRTDVPFTPDVFLWDVIKDRTTALSFMNYYSFVNRVMDDIVRPRHSRRLTAGPSAADSAEEAALEAGGIAASTPLVDEKKRRRGSTRTPSGTLVDVARQILDHPENFTDEEREMAVYVVESQRLLTPKAVGFEQSPEVQPLASRIQQFGLFDDDAYQLLKLATEFFLLAEVGRLDELGTSRQIEPTALTPEFIAQYRNDYLQQLVTEGTHIGRGTRVLPYMNIIADRLGELPIRLSARQGVLPAAYGMLRTRMASPPFVELIWNYWTERGMLVQTINMISLRFQNVRRKQGTDPLANLEIDPLRPLSNLLWGYLQDEINRLSVNRRAYEYAHGLGLQLVGRAVPDLHPADVRTQFLPAFHDLLRLAWIFFREDDDTTLVADAFPMLNALRELHFVVSEGASNQFGDLPMRSRIEMLMQQWLLARPEMRDFLRGRTMVPYPEPWMDRVDAMKTLQGWNDASVINYADLANFGEQIMLSVRYGSWSTTVDQNQAANWARSFRPEIQRYTHALRIVSGIDLSTGDVIEVRTASERYAQGVTAGRIPTPGGTLVAAAPPPARPLPPRAVADKLLRPAQASPARRSEKPAR